MALSLFAQDLGDGASLIRKFFTEGLKLKKIHGEKNVYDLSLGNPCLVTPFEFTKNLISSALERKPYIHGYVPNLGIMDARNATNGAAGAITILLKAITDPGDEILTFKPYFTEYVGYAKNVNAKLVPIPTKFENDFIPELDVVEEYINKKTRAVMFSNPNNPTGSLYSQDFLNKLGALLDRRSKKNNRPIYMIGDDPYQRLVYDGTKPTSVFKSTENSFSVSSFSKDLSLAGERIGYLAMHPEQKNAQKFLTVFPTLQRILGFVNANHLMQRTIAKSIKSTVDLEIYNTNRKIVIDAFKRAGAPCVEPKGAFYAFPKLPEGVSDFDFVNKCMERLLLIVPGIAFGTPGFIRICYAYDTQSVRKGMEIFVKTYKEYNK
ncbi:aspartate aminotransferase yhdr-related [Anaeramoeba flamelloides]|uniref:Aspartate aminotransferase yhdr-related n=1 Tax=Anaeramoeba flamelloides TaxID=1746091 RepID=A0ABQ8ZES2_9EUKA|nr:aspartate aminotransferase yhdr-related [Anaeramoeba flamelloides]